MRSTLLDVAKRVTPPLSRGAHRLGAMPRLEDVTSYLHFLAGQGAGTGWDEGESIVAGERLRAVDEPVIVDVGANAGQWTAALRERLGHHRGQWVLFEPTVELVRRLETLPNVDIVAAAAGEREEQHEFWVPTEPSGWMTLHERGDTFSKTKEFVRREVPVVRLDEELASRGIERVDFLKMDVEGHELFVLKGAGRLLEDRRIAALTFEFGAANVNSRTFFRDFWSLLDGHGYRIRRISPGGGLVDVPRYYETLEYFRGATNYLAVAAD